MRVLFWNIRGMGRMARVRQLKEVMAKERMDATGIQETIKQNFSFREMQVLNQGADFGWEWIPTVGHSGGILMEVKTERYEVESWETGSYYVGATIRDRMLNIRCEVITVYGPADHDWSISFLEEIATKTQNMVLPTIIGGDFNLIWTSEDRSSGGGDQKLMDAFNSFIEKFSLREIYRNGPKFTWTNKRDAPIQSNIDRVLANTEWELKFPLCWPDTLTRIGSDHCPLLLDSDGGVTGGGQKKERQFF
jgi:exonuclease III